MSSPTRGYLECQEGGLQGKRVEFMFNPTEYSISKSNSWTQQHSASRNVSHLKFGGGEPRQLTLELFFDSYLPRKQVKAADVRKATNQLFNFMMIDEKLKGQNSRMGRPPQCRLTWGGDSKHHFDCYITSCTVKYILFDGQSGLPIRATANLTLKEVRDPQKLLPTNPTSLGEPGRRVWKVQEGERIDWIAHQSYGNANDWRLIADANANILPNPLELQAGISLVIPPR